MSRKTNTSEGSKLLNVKWTEDMDNVLIDAMLEQQAKGFRVDGTFTTTAYQNMIAICVNAFAVVITKEHIKNRIKTLKSHFNTCHDLFKNKSGISWNSTTKLFEAEDSVWADLIMANPRMKKWKITPLQNYDKLEELFSKDRATGSASSTCKEFMEAWTKGDEEHEDPNTVNHDYVPPSQSDTEQSTASKTGKRKLSYYKDVVIENLECTNKKMDQLVNCLQKTTDLLQIQLQGQTYEKHSQQEILDELARIGVQDRIGACLTLMKSPENCQIFFNSPAEMRLDIINYFMAK